MTTATVRNRICEYVADLTDAPHTRGLTAALNYATVAPDYVEMWASRSVIRARLDGPIVMADGITEVRTSVTVFLSGGPSSHDNVEVPQWLRDLHEENAHA